MRKFHCGAPVFHTTGNMGKASIVWILIKEPAGRSMKSRSALSALFFPIRQPASPPFSKVHRAIPASRLTASIAYPTGHLSALLMATPQAATRLGADEQSIAGLRGAQRQPILPERNTRAVNEGRR